MHTYDAHGLPYFIGSSGVLQFREVCYTVVSYAPYILLQNYTITNLATFLVIIFDFSHPGPQPIKHYSSLYILMTPNEDTDEMSRVYVWIILQLMQKNLLTS